MIQKRKKRNSSKVNLIVSVSFHVGLVLVVLFFAAREGLVGKKLRLLAVTMVPKEKPPEPPKEKPPEPKVEPPKVPETPKMAMAPPPEAPPPPSAPPPAVDTAPPMAAPAAVSLPAFEFSDGAKQVQTISDPNGIYKALVQSVLREHWNRPEDMADDKFAAQVEVSVDPSGRLNDYRWLSGSGNKRWDDSVRAVMDQIKSVGRPPPKGFPSRFDVRFDVETVRSEPVLNLNVQ